MKTSVGRVLWIVFVGVGLFSACSSHKTSPIPNTRCSNENPCPSDLYKCVDGFCEQVCADPSDCPDGMICLAEDHCVTPCQTKDDCADDERCFGGVCKPVCIDADKDGFGKNCPLGDDCDDAKRGVHPGVIEICGDGIDNNCNGQTDETGCGCALGSKSYCYTGPAGTENVGICHGGESVCGADLNPGPCIGEQVPEDEVCDTDGTDENCNEEINEGWLNSCGYCKATLDEQDPVEQCGDGVDNNCNGEVDENCSLYCCRKAGEPCTCNYSLRCDEQIDVTSCDTCDYACLCEEDDTACVCKPPEQQPCYAGTADTVGIGACKSGLHDCIADPGEEGTYIWTECVGQVLPTTECAGNVADGIDNDCDGLVDETCCTPSTTVACYTGPTGTKDKGICHGGTAVCGVNGAPETCTGEQAPIAETCNGLDDNCNGVNDDGVANACGACGEVPAESCGDGLDNNCDGHVDENCGCNSGAEKDCYRGPVSTAGVGLCIWGTMHCINGEFWSDCAGDVLPQPELCDTLDNDCDGLADNGCGCVAETFVDCYTGPQGTENRGICHHGTKYCQLDGTYTACDGEQLPTTEDCNGLDEDCDGVPDNGVLAACGKCPDEPCYEEIWDTPGDCEVVLSECGDGIAPVQCPGATSGTDCITLGEGSVQTPYIYLAIYNHNEVAKLDTETGALIWKVSSYGRDPSRTAVALDQTVWVANRAVYQGGYSDPQYSNIVHLAADGSLICRADTPYVARSVAIDGDGNVWAATWYANNPTGTPANSYPAGKLLFKISGTQVDAGTPPRCHIISTTNLTTPTNYLPNSGSSNGIYGLAVDGNGFLWTASNPKLTIDTTNPTSIYSIPTTNTSFYGISIDQNNDIWVGGDYGTGGYMHKVHCNTRDANNKCTSATTTNSALSDITGMAVDKDGNIWGADCGGNRLVKVNPSTLAVLCYKNVNTARSTCPWGVAVDSAGKVWATNRYSVSHQVWVDRFDPDCASSTRDSFFVDDNHTGSDPQIYTYSDMTGFQLQNITTSSAHWKQRFDSGYLEPSWDSAVFDGVIPENTSISLSFVAADTEALLATAPASQKCGPYAVNGPAASPPSFKVDLTQEPQLTECAGLNEHRWLMVDVQLTTTQNGVKPIFQNLHVSWTRPLTLP